MLESRLLLKEVMNKAGQLRACKAEISSFSEIYCKAPDVIHTISQLRALTISPPILDKGNGLFKIQNIITKAIGKTFKFVVHYDYANHKSSLKGHYTVSSMD
ncbi:uncharacterized protein A4U43_C03F18480 [Asparagus officinalis]|uniref:Uncharacterized protein n=1 Tax=Asparagus officinalis TaxID=4686 RepID=A0A5P1FB50_ASPOF|nr:uncharacterized protein A4U43_C03F18480 [Asparagus officinalis]